VDLQRLLQDVDTVMRGLSEENGSWKTIWMRVRKRFRSRRSAPARRSARGSWKITWPESAVTPRMSSLLTVVLPQPLSPTSPRHSPRLMSKLTSSTAA
jgi:hypothetical protein